MQVGDLLTNRFDGYIQFDGNLFDGRGIIDLGQELVQRRIQETDRYGTALHGLVDPDEVFPLHGQDLHQGLAALVLGGGKDHFTDSLDTVCLEEHMLGTAQADAFGAEAESDFRVMRRIGIGADLQVADSICPAHQTGEIAGDGGIDGRDGFAVDVAGGTVEGDPVAFAVGAVLQGEALVLFIHLDLAAAGNTAGAHTTGNNRSVGSHAAAHGQDALCVVHAFDIFRRGLQTNQDNLLTLLGPGGSILRGKYDTAAGSAGGSR